MGPTLKPANFKGLVNCCNIWSWPFWMQYWLGWVAIKSLARPKKFTPFCITLRGKYFGMASEKVPSANLQWALNNSDINERELSESNKNDRKAFYSACWIYANGFGLCVNTNQCWQTYRFSLLITFLYFFVGGSLEEIRNQTFQMESKYLLKFLPRWICWEAWMTFTPLTILYGRIVLKTKSWISPRLEKEKPVLNSHLLRWAFGKTLVGFCGLKFDILRQEVDETWIKDEL